MRAFKQVLGKPHIYEGLRSAVLKSGKSVDQAVRVAGSERRSIADAEAEMEARFGTCGEDYSLHYRTPRRVTAHGCGDEGKLEAVVVRCENILQSQTI